MINGSRSTLAARSILLLVALAAAIVVPAHAATPPPLSVQKEGTHAWGEDNWCYVVTRGQWARMSYFRTFPVTNNRNVYDIYNNGQFVERVDKTQAGWIKRYLTGTDGLRFWMATPASQAATGDNVWILRSNNWVSLNQLLVELQTLVARQRAQGVSTSMSSVLAASVIGGGITTTFPKPIYVSGAWANRPQGRLSDEAEALRLRLGTMVDRGAGMVLADGIVVVR